VGAARFLPNGWCVASGSDDGTARIFDLRSYAQLNKVSSQRTDFPVTSVCPSKTGRILFTAFEDGSCLAWDSLKRMCQLQQLGHPRAHRQHISCIDLNSTGQALATGSWDNKIKIWA
jgi:WD40 repeat protein